MNSITLKKDVATKMVAAGIDLDEAFGAGSWSIEGAKTAQAVKAPKPDPKFRTKAAKAKGRETTAQIWARHYEAAGVKRFKDLTPAQQKAAKADVAAAWKSIPGTRKTKVS